MWPWLASGSYGRGSVGCGKSMLMDLFYDRVPVEGGRKLRIHFHSFMRDVLVSLHRLNQGCTPEMRQLYDDDLTQLVAKSIAKQVRGRTRRFAL
jgi:predicted ATPase